MAELSDDGRLAVSSPQRKRRNVPRISGEGPEGVGKMRKVSRACDACKRRKGKCSGTNPCTICHARGLECRYLTPYGRGRPPTPERAHGYSGILTHTPGSRECASAFDGVDDADSQSSRRVGFRSESHPGRSQLAQQQPRENDYQPQAGQSQQQRTFPPSRASPELGITDTQGQYVDPTSGLAFLHRAGKRLSTHPRYVLADNNLYNDHARHQSQMTAGDKPYDIDLGDESRFSAQSAIPDQETALELVVFYFEVCIATYRFLHRPTVERWLATIQQNRQTGRPVSYGLGETSTSIVLVVIAIAAFHRGKSRGDENIRWSDRLFLSATQLFDSATGFPHLESVQARLIQVLYLLHTSRMNQAWYVFGNALQMISAIGLYRREGRSRNVGPSANAAPVDYVKSQSRKRTFWTAYILDQYLGVMFGRPRHFHDGDIDQTMPELVDDEDMTTEGPRQTFTQKDCSLTSLVCHAKLARILAKITTNVYSISQPSKDLIEVVRSLNAELKEWKQDLPPILGSVNAASLIAPFRRQTRALKLAYSHGVMYATRPFLLKDIGANDVPNGSIKEIVDDCISAATTALEMVDSMASDGTLFHAFWWTHYVSFCALAVVYVWQIQQRAPFKERLFELAERCQVHLAQATDSNSPSRRYSIILQELREEAKQHAAGIALRSLFDGTRPQHEGMGPATMAADLDSYQQPGAGAMPGNDAPGLANTQRMDVQQAAMAPGAAGEWNTWQTTDWLDIDSLAFGQFTGLSDLPQSWVPEL